MGTVVRHEAAGTVVPRRAGAIILNPNAPSLKVQMLKQVFLGEFAPTHDELVFAPPRLWRFDHGWPDLKVALEWEGGIHTGGRHVRSGGYGRDLEKYDTAATMGWWVIRFTYKQLELQYSWCEQTMRAMLEYAQAHQRRW